jgi:quercetin dioxygenase-like cupin family protein
VDIESFRAGLLTEGFQEFSFVERAAGEALGIHSHPFEAKALIVAGEITLIRDGQPSLYAAGDVFHLPRDAPHAEHYGSSGVRYFVGRKSL